MSDNQPKSKNAVFRLTLIAMFIAIMLVMNFTPTGYITTGLFSITLLTIPVALGAACLGPAGGLILGFVFGLTSFLQAFGIGFIVDPSAATLFAENPFGYTVMCFVPRILTGLVSGFVFYLFKKRNKIGFPAFIVSAGIVPIINTLFFMTFFALFYRNTILGGVSFMTVILSAFTINFVIEFAVTVIAGAAINKAIFHYARRYL